LETEKLAAEARKEQIRLVEERKREEVFHLEKKREQDRIISDYENQMPLKQQLADEIQKNAILRKEKEMQLEINAMQNKIHEMKEKQTQTQAENKNKDKISHLKKKLKTSVVCTSGSQGRADPDVISELTECDDSQLHVLLSEADALEHELQGHSPPPWPSQVPRTIRPSEAQSFQAYRGRSQIPQDSVVQLLADLPHVP